MNRLFTSPKQKFSAAFSIVEIIIVVTVISILATITIVSYGQWRERVAETEVKSDMASVQAAMEDARNRTNEYPVFPEGAEFDGVNETKDLFTPSEGVLVIYSSGDEEAYCVDVRSTVVPGVYLFYNSADGSTEPTVGTCAGGMGASPPSPDQTVFVFDTNAPGCGVPYSCL